MKAYTTKHILSIIGLTLLIGIPFGFLYGWLFCWKNIGCNLLLAIGVAAGCTAMSDVYDPSIKVIIITAACLLCFVSGYLTRKVWLNNMPRK